VKTPDDESDEDEDEGEDEGERCKKNKAHKERWSSTNQLDKCVL